MCEGTKTVLQALRDEAFYPIPMGFVENVSIKRNLDAQNPFTSEVATSKAYRGALADCLCSLAQAVNISEADKSVGSLTDQQREALLGRANRLYRDLGEEEVSLTPEPMVYIGG